MPSDHSNSAAPSGSTNHVLSNFGRSGGSPRVCSCLTSVSASSLTNILANFLHHVGFGSSFQHVTEVTPSDCYVCTFDEWDRPCVTGRNCGHQRDGFDRVVQRSLYDIANGRHHWVNDLIYDEIAYINNRVADPGYYVPY